MNEIFEEIWEEITGTTFPKPGQFRSVNANNIEAFVNSIIAEYKSNGNYTSGPVSDGGMDPRN